MQTQLFEIYCAGFKSAADLYAVSLQTAQRLQQQQVDALQKVIHEQTRLVGVQMERSVDFWSSLWGAARGNQEQQQLDALQKVWAEQSRIAGVQMERTVDFWTNLWGAARDNQDRLISEAQAQLGKVRDAAQEEERRKSA
jgi:hypothetical protein